MRGIHVRHDKDWVFGERVDRAVEVNFAPSYVVAKVSVAGLGGRDLAFAFISGYRQRRDPNGAEEWVSVGEYEPPMISGDKISSVTFWRRIYAASNDFFYFSVLSEIQFW